MKGLRNKIMRQEVSWDMLAIYKLLNQKMDNNLAMICFLLINIVFWFLIGSLFGALIAALLFDRELIVSCAVTLGACLALILGYVKGYIFVIRYCLKDIHSHRDA